MLSPSIKIAARIKNGLKKFQSIIEESKKRDINESDTVILLVEMFSEIFGFDTHTDITTELKIKSTFCDLALKIDGKKTFLVEAKAIGIELKDSHVKQVVDYAANDGMEWVILSNAIKWKIFKVEFSKPIEHTLVFEFDILELNHKNHEHIEMLFMITKEACNKSLLEDYSIQKEATNKFIIGNLLFSDSVLYALRKEIKNIYPDVRVIIEEIICELKSDIIRREILEGENSIEAVKKINRAAKKKERIKESKTEVQQEKETAP